MKKNQFNIGDTITILQKPQMWSSELSNNNPLRLEYPWTGIITDLRQTDYGLAGLINDYGFAMGEIKHYTLNQNIYEIY